MRIGWPPFDRLSDAAPHARLLSNGRLSVLLSSAGTRYSAWGDTLLSAWDGDRVEDSQGWFVYVRDLERGEYWSAGLQPVPGARGEYAARYTPGRVTFERRVADLDSSLSACVMPEADVGVRRLTITNRSDRPRRIEVTSYLDVVLNSRGGHAAHPAFSKLVVDPRIPDEWPGFSVRLRLPQGAGEYEISVENPARKAVKVQSVTAEGKAVDVSSGIARVALVKDGGRHEVRVVFG